ncbi:WD40 protein [Talaromyces proteolyticus]|uniref:WD40 protein n=1 Tax=Talaromyces proteolyticus TaxID=1131652 RepID=A0AAD4PTR6_9EURO|nr:WD40 protein [Talaromyces proteolyticus]KAH8689134.1 WD40 protein [Talaromyces proteolyticus]
MKTQQYTVGWICAIPTEAVAACAMLDEEHPPLEEQPRNDNNAYTLGSIGHHNVVIACLPKGKYGIASTASLVTDMLNTFESIRFGLMVGIGGGAPDDENNMRLGDVVVGASPTRHGGVIPYDFGRAVQGQEFEITRSLNSPPKSLLTALSQLDTFHQLKGMGRINDFLSRITENPRLKKRYARPSSDDDRLYRADYVHPQENLLCAAVCDTHELQQRKERDTLPGDNFVVHYGVIASGDKVIRDAIIRDKLRQKHDILCFEMEAAGLTDNFPCLVIRGICDYSDSHKNDLWQGYAAATAAAYAKELLHIISPAKVMHETTAAIVQTMVSRSEHTATWSDFYQVGGRNVQGRVEIHEQL